MLCDSLDSLDEPDARAAMVWIIGEYAERIDNADELLESFLEARARAPPWPAEPYTLDPRTICSCRGGFWEHPRTSRDKAQRTC